MEDTPYRGFNCLRLLRNGDDQLVVGEDRELPVLLIALHAIETERQPVGERKVDGFIEVQLKAAIVSDRIVYGAHTARLQAD